MRLVRTILALVIAASLALLPVGVSAGTSMTVQSDAESSMRMDAAPDMSMDCCPDGMKTAPHQDDMKCPMSFCCTYAATALNEVAAIRFDFHSAAVSRIVMPGDQVVSNRGANPPFRPPRA